MYIRRKVFSIIEDENGEERLFSTIEFVNEEDYLQREFGWREKVLRPVKAKIGRARRKIADKLYESGSEDVEKVLDNSEVIQKIKETGIRNKDLRNKILKNEVPKANSTVSFNAQTLTSQEGGKTIKKDAAKKLLDNDILDSLEKGDQKLIKKVTGKGKSSGIAVDKDTPVEFIAHEIGHAKGETAKGIRKSIMENDPRTKAEGYTGSISTYGKREVKKDELFDEVLDKGGVTGKQAIKDLKKNTKNSIGVISEEAAASLSALKDLKRAGASSDELKRAAKNLKTMGSTYVQASKGGLKTSLGRVIDIPSRRSANGNVII